MTARTVENAKLYRDEWVIVGTLSKAETDAVGGLKADAEGIIDQDVDQSIHNLTCIGKEAMCSTDDMVLRIMTQK